ncbi:MAG: LuxR C-terminal-related transcriptional regulator [Gammaproteobacteria bacterium]|nr:LuxR C-terminal-related transcriptional regulator [Gammaproteobacteria bacterium]
METIIPLVTTSFSQPVRKSRLVARPTMLNKLIEGSDKKLMLIQAPAGFGKTTLAGDFFDSLSNSGKLVAWLSIDANHSDPVLLLRYLVAAIRTVVPNFGEAANTLLNLQSRVRYTSIVMTLVNELQILKDDLYFIIDDFHFVLNQESNEMMCELVTKAPSMFHLLIVTRETPHFPLGRLRELDQLLELIAEDLKFTAAEVREFCLLEKLELSDEDLDRLNKNTEGWAAGLQLAVIAMRNRKNVSKFVNSFAGGHRAIVEFLSEDVLSRQPTDVQDFLIKTSLMDRICAELCDDLLGIQDSAQMLHRIEDANLFLFPLDDSRTWYRYHHLFSEFLQQTLKEQHPSLAKKLALKASVWFRERGFLTESVQYAFAADDTAYALKLLNETSETIFASGQFATLNKYIECIPESTLADYPCLQLDRVWFYTLNWDFEKAQHILNNVKSLGSLGAVENADKKWLDQKILHREFMLALFTDQMTLAEDLINQWLDISDGQNLYLKASAKTSLLYARREQYDCRHIGEQATVIRPLYINGDAEFGTVWHDCIVGPAYVLSGNLERAAEIYTNAIQTAERINGSGSSLAAMPSLLLAEVHYERNELEEAEELLNKNLALATDLGFLDQLIAGYICKSKLEFLRSEFKQALKTLDTGEEIAAEHSFFRFHANILNERIRQLVLSGQSQEAFRILHSSQTFIANDGFDPTLDVTTSKEAVVLAWTRVNNLTDQRDEIIRVLRKWVKYVDRLGCYRSAIRFSLALALTLRAAGETVSAKRYLRQALIKASVGSFIRTFIDEGPTMCLMIKDLINKSDISNNDAASLHCRRLVQIYGSNLSQIRDNQDILVEQEYGVGTVIEPLSERELEILKLVGIGMANQEIASQLGLSFATVKWYLQQIFGKLNVHRRYSAVNRAKQLGIM